MAGASPDVWIGKPVYMLWVARRVRLADTRATNPRQASSRNFEKPMPTPPPWRRETQLAP